MQINNSLVILIFVSLEFAVVPRFRLTQGERDTDGGIVTTQMPSKGIRTNLVVKQKVRCLPRQARFFRVPIAVRDLYSCGPLSHKLEPNSEENRDAAGVA